MILRCLLMEELIYVVYDNKITTMDQRRIPVNGTFTSTDVGKVTSTLVMDWDKNKEYFWSVLK